MCMFEELVDSKDTAYLIGMPHTTLNYQIRQGIVKPRLAGRGRGSTKVLALRQCLAIALARAITKGGNSIELAFCVARVLEAIPTAEIEESFRRGATCLMIMQADGGHIVVPRLVTPDAITDNPVIQDVRDAAAFRGIKTKVFGINVSPLMNQIYGRYLRLRRVPELN